MRTIPQVQSIAPQPMCASGCLEVQALDVTQGGVSILRGVSFVIEPGQLMGVIGPNGGGKTTLVRGLLGLVQSRRGRVMYDHKPLNPSQQNISYVPQQAQVDWEYPITVAELVELSSSQQTGRWGSWLKWSCWTSRAQRVQIHEKLQKALRDVDLLDQAHTPVSHLSGGQRQRAMLARALLSDGGLFLLDEPFAGVDLASQALIWRVIHRLRDRGCCVILVHHDLAELEAADRLLLVSQQGIYFGLPEQVLQSAAFGRAFGLPYRALQGMSLTTKAQQYVPRLATGTAA